MELGRAMITLKEAKQTVEDPVKFSSHCPLVQTKRVSLHNIGSFQSVSLTHLLAWRTGPHAHTRCTRLAREPTRGTLSPAVALGPDCWTHNTQLTGQLTRWRCIVGFSGTDTGEEGGAQGQDTGLTN